MAKKISSLSVSLGATVKPFEAAFRGAGGAVNGLVGKLGSAGGAVLKFTGIAGGVGAIFGALKGAASGITLAAELEQVGVAFETMLGSGQAAKALMSELTAFSAATPFEFPEIAASAKKLLAFGVGAADMMNKLTMLGDVAAGIGAPLEDIASIYGKIKSRGQLTGETLNQMAERGIPIYAALAKEMGVAGTEVAGLVTKGQIGFKQVDAALAGLSAEGGQFSGMMAKQSQTLAGLWSTLTDNIGLTMAGMVTAMVDAFSLRGALSSLTGAIGNIGGMLTAGVARWAPIILGWTKSLWDVITGAWSAIVGWLTPIVTGIGDHIARNWQTAVTSTTAYLSALWSAVGSIFNAVWGIVKTIGSAIVSVWNAAMGAMGIQTASTGSTIGNVFQTIADASRWLMDKVTLALNVISYAVTNWRDTFELAAAEVALFVVKTGNQIAYQFTDVIPGLLTWFANNWRDIFTTMASFTAATFTNMGKNVAGFFTAVWSFLKGDGFNFEWTGLTEGFENTIKELPQIAERQIGPMESALQQQANGLRDSFAGGLAAHLAEQERLVKGTTDAIAGAVDVAGNLLTPPNVAAPTIDPVVMDVQADTDEIDAVAAKAKETADSLKSIFAGTAEAQRAQYAGAFAAKLSPMTVSATTPTSPATPVPAAAPKAVREDAAIGKALDRLVELAEIRNRTLTDIHDDADALEGANI